MPFNTSDASVGMIAYFTIDALRQDKAIQHTGGSPNNKPRPFVCYAKDGTGALFWTPLTTTSSQSERTPLQKEWIRRPTGKFKTEQVIVNDGRHTYAGPAERFAAHSNGADNYTASSRPYLTAPGIDAVLAAVTERNGLRPQLNTSPNGDGVA